jgi:hypothetical protein
MNFKKVDGKMYSTKNISTLLNPELWKTDKLLKVLIQIVTNLNYFNPFKEHHTPSCMSQKFYKIYRVNFGNMENDSYKL